MYKILVLIATYNGEKYLQQQLDSIYCQKNVDVDILVRDDGSTDKTTSILEQNALMYNLTWYQGTHMNVQKGFFELMKMAAKKDYQYYAFADQDDVWDNDKLEIAVNSISIDEPALYYSGQRLVDSNLNFIENHKLNQYRSLHTRFVLSDFAGCTGVFNRKLLESVIRYEPEYMLMHDTWILRVCLCLGGKVVVDPEPRMSYRQHSTNRLGLGHNAKAIFRQVKQYLNEYQIERLTKELLKGYEQEMVPEYLEIAKWICCYRDNFKAKIKLLHKNNINFCDKGLNLTYFIKIITNKL